VRAADALAARLGPLEQRVEAASLEAEVCAAAAQEARDAAARAASGGSGARSALAALTERAAAHEGRMDRMEAALGSKLDMDTFLAVSASRARALAAGSAAAAGGSGGGGGSASCGDGGRRALAGSP
jgi:hypothetical protein